MTRWQKFTIGAEAFGWLFVALAGILIAVPVGLVLMMAGMLLSLIHIDFVADWAGCFLHSLAAGIQKMTKRVRRLVRKAEALEAEAEAKEQGED